MSDVLNLQLKKRKVNVTLYNPLENNSVKTERDENYLTRELEKQYKDGFAEGEKVTMEKLESRFAENLNARYQELDAIRKMLEQILPAYEKSFEKSVINLSVLIAEKIVQREILRDSIITVVLKEALKKVIGANNVIVKLNPDDYEKLDSIKEETFSIDSFDKINFERDNRVEPGGCLIETEIGSADARISSQFTELRKQLEINV